MALEPRMFMWRDDRLIAQASLVAACLCSVCGGVVYTFSLYGPQLGQQLGFSSVQLNIVAISGNMGVYLSSPVFGILADTYPPSSLNKIATILYLFGFFAMALTFDGTLKTSNFLIVAVYYFLVGTASGCAYITAISTAGHNFKEKRGLGIGLPATFFGLSAFLFSFLNHTFFVDGGVHDTAGFLKLMGILTSLLTLAASSFLVKVNLNPRLEESRFISEPSASYYTFPEDDMICSQNESPILQPTNHTPEQDIGGRDLFYNREAQLLFVCILIVAGAGIVYINNVGTILHSLQLVGEVDDFPRLQSLNVSLLSVSNCAGRFLFTAMSDWLANLQRPIRRINWLIASGLIVGTIHFVTGYVVANYIVLCSVVLGLGYGVLFAVAPTLTSIWFGTAKFGSNWGWMCMAPAIGGQFLSLLFGVVYDSNLPDVSEGDNLCKLGFRCYRLSLQVTSMLCFLASILAYLLKKRRSSY